MSDHMTQAEVRDLATRLLKINGLYGWTIAFGTAKARAGSCKYDTKTLRFSTVLMGARTRNGTADTVRHEVAHAIAGYSAAHGPAWHKVYVRLGGKGGSGWDPAESLLKPEEIFRWAYTCAKCGDVLGQSIRRRGFKVRKHKNGKTSPIVTKCCYAKVLSHPINQPISRFEAVS